MSDGKSAGVENAGLSITIRTTLADQAFSHAAPMVWNALLPTVFSMKHFFSFKKAFKTRLYQLAHET